jgi:IMP dehydrogenase
MPPVFRKQPGLTYDDVLLVPQHSTGASRAKVGTSTRLGNLHLTVPFVSANMDTVTGPEMAIAMGKLGGLGILHRYATTETVLGWIERIREEDEIAVPSVGIKSEDLQAASRYLEAGLKAICVDVAHGHSDTVAKMVSALKKMGWDTVIAGNVATADATKFLINAGADVIKVGVGPGSMCTTRLVTGHGVPQLTAVLECSEVARSYSKYIIADGGIRHPGDVVKAIAAGAHAVMLGGVLAGTDETPGEWLSMGDGLARKKVFRGMASAAAQTSFRGSVSNGTPEGETTLVDSKGSAADVINVMLGGLRSGLTYHGAANLQDLHEYAEFVEVSGNTVYENGPHGKR